MEQEGAEEADEAEEDEIRTVGVQAHHKAEGRRLFKHCPRRKFPDLVHSTPNSLDQWMRPV
jgi:hypothetical protein